MKEKETITITKEEFINRVEVGMARYLSEVKYDAGLENSEMVELINHTALLAGIFTHAVWNDWECELDEELIDDESCDDEKYYA